MSRRAFVVTVAVLGACIAALAATVVVLAVAVWSDPDTVYRSVQGQRLATGDLHGAIAHAESEGDGRCFFLGRRGAYLDADGNRSVTLENYLYCGAGASRHVYDVIDDGTVRTPDEPVDDDGGVRYLQGETHYRP
ncbi:hypothetical protein [Jatrophihabitans endophyticus]|uniref:hypothetical protein n=1 Tax=Jatrophihabitans endophyticus TaxID=1206085 RepID=UPI00093219CC|nr:hypothetical protein [Jatrophihabitans endophyticus]